MMNRFRQNLGFFLAGAVLFGVLYNVYYEINNVSEGPKPCPCILTQ